MTLWSFIKPGETKPEQENFHSRPAAIERAATDYGLPVYNMEYSFGGQTQYLRTATEAQMEKIATLLEAVGFRFVPVEIVEVGK